MPRMKDVAARAGVSASTVSHVINKTRFVSEAARERVLRAMQELNFHKNAHARRLARGWSDFLGLIISDIENPFFPELIKSFQAAAHERGYEVLLATTDYNPARAEAAFTRMIENRSPGVAVMTSGVDPSLARVFEQSGVASVFLDSGGVGPRKSSVRVDYSRGAVQAVNYLYNLGHRNWAMIAGPQNRPSHVACRKAIEDAVARVGQRIRIVEGESNLASGELGVQQLLTTEAFPTAILCSNDMTAIGAIRALSRLGLAVPGQVSVIGIDDIPIAELTEPPLTTIRIPRDTLGRVAFEVLDRMLSEKSATGFESTVETSLVIRGSAGPAHPAAMVRRAP